MRFFDSAAVDRALSYPALVDILQAAFRQGAIAPLRHHHAIARDGRPEATLLLMPAWESAASGSPLAGRYLGVKTVTVFPDNNAARGKPAVFGTYLLLSAGLIQIHDQIGILDIKVSRWVIERKMTILAYAKECNIDRRQCDGLANTLENLGKIPIAIE